MRFRLTILLLVAAISAAVWCLRGRNPEAPIAAKPASLAATPEEEAPPALPAPFATSMEVRRDLTENKRLAALRAQLERKDAKAGESVLTFRDAAALQRFLSRASALGVRVLGRLDALHAVCVGFDDLNALGADLNAYPDDYGDLAANLLVYPPSAPTKEQRDVGRQTPFDHGVLDFLGVTGDRSTWGRGIGIAVLDSGVSADGGLAALRFLDIGMGVAPGGEEGHGTAVASLAAGSEFGLAPGANLLSIRVTGADGLSDAFTLAQGIIAAADAGVRVINISMGSYAPSSVLGSAIDYATTRGIVLVASAGNDQATQLTWPAADPRVVSVGAVDAGGRQVLFSNSGDGLSISAPGYGVPVTWLGGQPMLMDGTSASAPLVSGAIAAIMSQSPGVSATQAWQILQGTTSDSGPAGRDPDFGYGILNLGWAMHRSDPSWIDTAVADHWVNQATGTVDFLVQNRSGTGVNGLELDVTAGGDQRTFTIPWLAPGGVYTASIPINGNALRDAGRIEYRSELKNPGGMVDAVPGNNRRATSLSVPK